MDWYSVYLGFPFPVITVFKVGSDEDLVSVGKATLVICVHIKVRCAYNIAFYIMVP